MYIELSILLVLKVMNKSEIYNIRMLQTQNCFSIYPEMRYHYAREVNSLDVSTMKEKTSIFIHVPALIRRKIIVKLHNCC